MRHSKRLYLYKLAIILFLIIVIIWPRVLTQEAEIDSRALAVAIGIDINEDDDRGEILASAQILVPVPQGQQTGKQEVLFGTGKTLAEALAYIDVKTGRILDFGQVGLIIIGENKAKKGVLDELKYLINNKVRAEATLFITHKIEARELLQNANSLTEEAASSLNNLLKFNAQSIYMPSINLLEFLSDSNMTDHTSFVPILNILPIDTLTLSDGNTAKKGNEGEEVEEGKESSGKEEDRSSATNEIKDVDRAFLFEKGKIVGELDNSQTRGLVWHNKDTHFGLICAKNVLIGDTLIDSLPCNLRGKYLKKTVHFEGETPIITFKFYLRFNSEDLHRINEIYDNAKPFSKAEINESIKRALELVIKEDMERTLEKLREANVDALRIRKEFYKFRNRKYKEYIATNDDFLQRVQVRYQFKTKLY